MSRGLLQYTRLLWQSMVFWGFAMFCFSVFRHYGLEELPGINFEPGFEDGKVFFRPLSILVFVGIALGVVYASIEFLFERYVSKKMTLGVSILLEIAISFISTIIVFTISLEIASNLFEHVIENEPGWWRESRSFWALILYILLCSFVFSFIQIATERFGKGVFLKMLVGLYRNPKEEERIFMFLDLKDSTKIAEELGHFTYSQFIQDCFFDLNKVVVKYDAEIYQYVGDEVVLSWPYEKGVINNNCIGLYFAFKHQKQSRKKYYLNKYGIFPVFKAGLHGGKLMVAEVGFVKKELAYHGDVINTSARIQAECNRFNVTILISELLLKDLKTHVHSKPLGSVKLKGKKQQVTVHTLITDDEKAIQISL